MKNTNKDIKNEYSYKDLEDGIRGKYYKSYQRSHNIVLLKPEIVKAFPTEEAVNKALMSLIDIANNQLKVHK